MEEAKWDQLTENKWYRKFSPTNYFFILVEPFENGSYQITCMDSELTEYDEEDQVMVRKKYDIPKEDDATLAFYVMEDKGYYEWKADVTNRKELVDYLDGWTSFPLHHLDDLKEYKDLDSSL